MTIILVHRQWLNNSGLRKWHNRGCGHAVGGVVFSERMGKLRQKAHLSPMWNSARWQVCLLVLKGVLSFDLHRNWRFLRRLDSQDHKSLRELLSAFSTPTKFLTSAQSPHKPMVNLTYLVRNFYFQHFILLVCYFFWSLQPPRNVLLLVYK